MLLRIPNLSVVEPGCNLEMRQALRAAVETHGPFYMRIVRCEVEENELAPDYQFRLGKGMTVTDGGVRRGPGHHWVNGEDREDRRGKAAPEGHPGAHRSPPQPEALRPGAASATWPAACRPS